MLAIPDSAPIRRIMLSEPHGIWCIVSAHRLPWAAAWRWNYMSAPNAPHRRYAKRNEGVRRTPVYLHREILKLKDPRNPIFYADHHGDHINGNPLDNRDENLRWATPVENTLNAIPWEDIPTLDEIVRGIVDRVELEAIPF